MNRENSVCVACGVRTTVDFKQVARIKLMPLMLSFTLHANSSL